MGRRVAIFFVLVLFLALHLSHRAGPIYLFLAIPFLFLSAFLFFTLNDRVCAIGVVAFSVAAIAYEWVRSNDASYFVSIGLYAFALWVVQRYRDVWNRKIEGIELQKREMEKETKTLEERHLTRLESLKHLEKRVNGLVHLFEIARHFNECLDFSRLISILNVEIVREVSFTRGTVILLKSEPNAEKGIERCFSFGSQQRMDEDLSAQFAQECLNVIGSSSQVIKIEPAHSQDRLRFSSYGTQFPLWLFPLFVEHHLIAVLAVEGGDMNDFQKLEILASQLALQVKKIRLYETVKETSILDGLTNVFVRRHFLERFYEELRRAVRFRFPLSVLMVDVDHFKSYNDEFGHLVGDRALREVAQIIRANIRRVDVIGRYGGEEFLIVAPEIEKKQGFELAERVRSAVARKRLQLYDEEIQLTVSIGLSSFPEDMPGGSLPIEGVDFSQDFVSLLIEKADQALYRAKEEGRNRVVGCS
ncbi:MAG: GGDEF domain-containing protein [Candidatus Omnitrophica bacterium]|nr:GGDEF domain-containing protein [Candidatus Omnitrophota bacterium]